MAYQILNQREIKELVQKAVDTKSYKQDRIIEWLHKKLTKLEEEVKILGGYRVVTQKTN